MIGAVAPLHIAGQHHRKDDQHGDGAGVNQHLHHRQEFGVQQHEEPGHGHEHGHQQQRRPEQVAGQHYAQGGADGHHAEQPEHHILEQHS